LGPLFEGQEIEENKSVWNYHYSLRNDLEEHRSRLLLGGSLNSSEYLLHDRGILRNDQTENWDSSKSYRISIPTSGHTQGVQYTVVFSGFVFRINRCLL